MREIAFRGLLVLVALAPFAIAALVIVNIVFAADPMTGT